MENNKLGRGLSALFGEHTEKSYQQTEKTTSNVVDIDLIIPNENQPRKYFDEDKINELSQSIEQHGILQPLAVRQNGNNYELIAGERRWRASKMLGLKFVPVNIIDCTETDVLTKSLVENIQRDDLNPIEEADAIKTIMSETGCTQLELSQMINKSRSHIANSMRLLTLPETVQSKIISGKLSAGHGKILASSPYAEQLADLAVSKNWNVRQLEIALKNYKGEQNDDNSTTNTPIEYENNQEETELSKRITYAINLETKLKITKNGGIIKIVCRTCEELENFTDKLIALGKQE